MPADVFHRFGKPLLDFLFFLEVGRGREADFGIIEIRIFQHPVPGEQRLTVVTAGETSMDMAGTDTEFQHHRRIALLRKFETVFHHLHDLGQVRPRVEQPDLGFHREGMAPFLDDACAFPVIFPQHDQRAAFDSCRGEVGKGVRSDIRPHRRLPGDRSAEGVVDRSPEHRGRTCFAGIRLEVHPQFIQQALGVRQHIHQVRHRRPLVTADVRNPGLQQGLGHRKDAFPVEHLSLPQPQQLNFFLEGPLHRKNQSGIGNSENLTLTKPKRKY